MSHVYFSSAVSPLVVTQNFSSGPHSRSTPSSLWVGPFLRDHDTRTGQQWWLWEIQSLTIAQLDLITLFNLLIPWALSPSQHSWEWFGKMELGMQLGGAASSFLSCIRLALRAGTGQRCVGPLLACHLLQLPSLTGSSQLDFCVVYSL